MFVSMSIQKSFSLSLSLSLSLSASLLFVPNVDKTESTSLHEWLPTSFYWHQVNGNSGLDNPARSLRTFFTKNVELQANENPSSHQCDVIRPNTLPNIGLRLQCDQIGRFLKVMGDKFSYKRNVNMLLILDLLKENITFKYRLLLGNVWIHMCYF